MTDRPDTGAPSTRRRDLYAEITDTLIAQIERNPGEPQMPWRRTTGAPLWMPKNAASGDHYRGINIVMLWATAEERGWGVPVWATYKQWQALGAQVRAGEKGARVVKYGEYEVEPGPEAEGDDGRRLYLKGYTVFNAEQVDGYQLPEPPPSLGPIARIARADAFLANLGARIEIGGTRAFYRPATDTIHMPDEGLFTGTDSMSRSESWYAVSAHEHGHWTSAKGRCERELGRRFGDKAYCAEELVAEVISAQICALLGITQDVRPDHSQYLVQWIELMRADAKAIFTAAAAASKAVDYMLSLQPPGFFPDLDRGTRERAAAAEITSRSPDTGPAAEAAPQRPDPASTRRRGTRPKGAEQ